MRKRLGRALLMLPFMLSGGLTAGEIKGVVKDKDSNAPVAGAMVIVAPGDKDPVMTDENGAYTVKGLKAGTYSVTANYAGATAEESVVVADEGTATASLVVAMSQAKATTYEITGTRIRTTNEKAVSPVTSVGETDVKFQGSTKIQDVVNTLPQAFPGQNSFKSNGSNGTATVNLRGLGAGRNLVLLDGRRMGVGAADLNLIPTSIIERVDVLTGGSSAVYGADAVSGVVNFITKKNFEGVQLDVDWSMYQHNQQNLEIQDLVRARGVSTGRPEQFAVPGDIWNLLGPSVALTFGANSPDGKGNVTAFASYRKDYGILQRDRDYSACALNPGDSFTCGGSGTATPARIGSFIVEGNDLRPRVASRDVYNFNPLNYYLRPDERYNLGANARYKLAPWAEAYSQALFMDDVSTGQIAPGGIFASPRTINCNNPFMSDAQRTKLGCSLDPNSTQTITTTVAKRNVEGGGRQSQFNRETFRYVLGLKGDISKEWNYDASMTYTATNVLNRYDNFFFNERVNKALIAVRSDPLDPNSPIVCQSFLDGSDPKCVPYNIFQDNGQPNEFITKEMLNYLGVPNLDGLNSEQRVVNVNLGGDLSGYGVRSPFAKDGIAMVVGGEYRWERIAFFGDYINSLDIDYSLAKNDFHVFEGFAEARIPLVQDVPAIKNLTLEGAYRYSNYSFGQDTHTFKAGGEWEFIDGLRFRGSFQRAVRAPPITALYSPQNLDLGGSTDPCALQGVVNPDPDLVARCILAFPGFDPLLIESNPAAQYRTLSGGNPDLKPEIADTFTVGILGDTALVPGLSFSVDYFDINLKEAHGSIGADFILKKCVEDPTANRSYCDLVFRVPGSGSLFIARDGVKEGYTFDALTNTGGLRTSGIDFFANYNLDLSRLGMQNIGRLTFNLNSTWLNTTIIQALTDGPTVDCAGLFGALCFDVNPEFRHKLRVTWATPVSINLSAQMRYISKVLLDANSDPNDPATGGLSNPDEVSLTNLELGNRAYLDLVASWTFKDTLTFQVGVNNVLDTDPPLVGDGSIPIGAGGNGNTAVGTYDPLGRYIFLNGTAKF